MLSTSVAILDIDRDHLLHWLQLVVPPAVLGAPRWALAIVAPPLSRSPPELRKVVVSGRGDVTVGELVLAGFSDAQLAALRTTLAVDFLLVLHEGLAGEIIGRVERALDPRASISAQGLAWLRVVKEFDGKGIYSSPSILSLVPAPPIEALTRTFDLLIPDRSTLVAYVFENDRSNVYASVIARKRKGKIDLITTHQSLEPHLSAKRLAREWQRDRATLCKVIETRFDLVAVGIFLDRAAFERILLGPPDQLGRELNGQHAFIDPAPTWLLGLLGGATVAAAASRGAKVLAGFLPKGARKMATDLATAAQDTLKERGAHPFSLLGFDPIALWLTLREFYRPRV